MNGSAEAKMVYFSNAYNETFRQWRDAIILRMKTFNPIKYRRLSKKIDRLDKRMTLYSFLEAHYWGEWRDCSQ